MSRCFSTYLSAKSCFYQLHFSFEVKYSHYLCGSVTIVIALTLNSFLIYRSEVLHTFNNYCFLIYGDHSAPNASILQGNSQPLHLQCSPSMKSD